MKTVLLCVVLGGFSANLFADLAISFRNTTLFLKPGETTPINSDSVLPAGTYAQLLWAPSNLTYRDGNLGLSLYDPGEILLAETYSTTTAARFNAGIGVYTDADVGGADINTGCFFARIWETAVPSPGAYFLELGIQGPTLTEYNVFNPDTVYYTNLGAEYPSGTDIAIDVQGTTVVPEPSSIGLMGIAGLGMFLTRRKIRR